MDLPQLQNSANECSQAFRGAISAISARLLERERETAAAYLALLSGESMFLMGPPGVAKSALVRLVQHSIPGAKLFDYLMGKFSTPDEIFGPVSIQKLTQSGVFEREVEGYLPSADLVFLDEVWKASSPIQNALLTALNERMFRNGQKELPLPMLCFFGASNETPEDDHMIAFWDRFLIRVELSPLKHADNFFSLVEAQDDPLSKPLPDEAMVPIDQLISWRSASCSVSVPRSMAQYLWQLRSLLEQKELSPVSDRRWKRSSQLLRASAFMEGRTEITPMDLGILELCLWSHPHEQSELAATMAQCLADYCPIPGLELLARGEQELANLEEAMAARAKSKGSTMQVEPAIYLDEYYRLIPSNGTSEELILIWIGDFDAVDREECTMELFRYQNQRFLGSWDARLQLEERGDSHRAQRISVDGVPHHLDVVERPSEDYDLTSLDQSDRASFRDQLEQYQAHYNSFKDLSLKLESYDKPHLIASKSWRDHVGTVSRKIHRRIEEWNQRCKAIEHSLG